MRNRGVSPLPNCGITIDRESHGRIADLCAEFVRRSEATCALLVGVDGALLHKYGYLEGLDTDSLSALGAATIAATAEMARLIGETRFDVFIQQGTHRHLQIFRVGDSAVLLALFDDRTTAGMVRLRGQDASRRLAAVLEPAF
jgi:predicted regulator of Ras-like GTPase activity (Roadblock/LC7/MglB family)